MTSPSQQHNHSWRNDLDLKLKSASNCSKQPQEKRTIKRNSNAQQIIVESPIEEHQCIKSTSRRCHGSTQSTEPIESQHRQREKLKGEDLQPNMISQ